MPAETLGCFLEGILTLLWHALEWVIDGLLYFTPFRRTETRRERVEHRVQLARDRKGRVNRP